MIPRQFQDKVGKKKQDNEFAIHIQMDRLVAKQEQNCSKCTDRIEALNFEIKQEKDYLIRAADKHNLQTILSILDHFSKRKKEMYKERSAKNLVKEKLTKIIYSEKEHMKELQKKIQSFSALGLYSHDLNKIIQTNNMLRAKLDHLDQQIECSDPFQYEQYRSQNLTKLSEKLMKIREENIKLADQVAFKESKQMLQKNKLVTSVGKLQYLKKQEEDRKQKLLSLQRHRDQIHQRNELMKRQHENHQGNSSEVLAAIERGKMFALELDREIRQVEQAIKMVKESITNLEKQEDKQEAIILKQINQLQEKDKYVSRKLKQGKDIEIESEKIVQSQIDAKQQFYKKLQKKEKRRSLLQQQIYAADLEIEKCTQQLNYLQQKKKASIASFEAKKIFVEQLAKQNNQASIKQQTENETKMLNDKWVHGNLTSEAKQLKMQANRQFDKNKHQSKQKNSFQLAPLLTVIGLFTFLIFIYYL